MNNELTKKKKLAKQIASIAEMAYRRGFQHGSVSGASEEDASWFRYECRSQADQDKGMFTFSTYAPEEGRRYAITGGARHTIFERLRMEIPNSETYAELLTLLREIGIN